MEINYDELSEALVDNITMMLNNRKTKELANSFKPGGQFHDILEILKTEKGDKAKFLHDRLADLGKKLPDANIFNILTIQFAVDELSASIEQGKSVKPIQVMSFFKTAFRTIIALFIRLDSKTLENSNKKLVNIKEKMELITKERSKQQQKSKNKEQGVNKAQEKTQNISKNQEVSKDKNIDKPIKKQQEQKVTDSPKAPPLSGEKEVQKKNQQEKESAIDLDDDIPKAPPLPGEKETPKKKGKENIKKSNKSVKAKPSDLLDQIKQRGGKFPKRVKFSKDQGEFKYVSTKPDNKSKNNNLIFQAMNLTSEDQSLADSLLENKSHQEQLNVLYSAMFDDKKDLVKDLCEHTTTQVIENDDWDLEEAEKKVKTFTKKEVDEVKAAIDKAKQRIKDIKAGKITEPPPKIKQEQKLDKDLAQKKDTSKISEKPVDIKNTVKSKTTEKKEVTKLKDIPVAPTLTNKSKIISAPKPKGDLLSQIRKGMKLKIVPGKDEQQASLDSDGFEYKSTRQDKQKKNESEIAKALNQKFNNTIDEDEIEQMLEDKTEKQKLNLLYSSVIDNNESLMEGLVEYGGFGNDDMKKIHDAVSKEATKNQKSHKKMIIEKGLENFTDEAGLKITNEKTNAKNILGR